MLNKKKKELPAVKKMYNKAEAAKNIGESSEFHKIEYGIYTTIKLLAAEYLII